MPSKRPFLIPILPACGPVNLLEEDLLVPRLVNRIAELEDKLFKAHLLDASSASSGGAGVIARFQAILRAAQSGLQEAIAFVAGDENLQNQELTFEATGQALMIALTKAQSMKDEGAQLRSELQAAQGELATYRAAVAETQAALASAREELAVAHDRHAAASTEQSTAAAEALDAVQKQAAALADQLEALQVATDVERRQAAAKLHAAEAQLASDLSAARAAAQTAEECLAASRARCDEWEQRATKAEAALASAAAEAGTARGARATASKEVQATRTRLEAAQAQAEDFQRRFLAERLERRRLHEELQALRGNIRVLARVRPATDPAAPLALSLPFPGAIKVAVTDRQVHDFEFSASLDAATSQAATFEQVWPVLRSCCDGYNVCIGAYGQRGSGKTYTMYGDEAGRDPGIVLRTLQALFDVTNREAREGGSVRTIAISMLTISGEEVRDLLPPTHVANSPEAAGLGLFTPRPGKTLEVSTVPPFTPERMMGGAERVPGRTWVEVRSADEATAVLARGTAFRESFKGCPGDAAPPARSHLLLCVRLTDPSGERPPSSLHLVDLAGSELGPPEQAQEALAVGSSLAALGDVVAALQARAPYVPYRSSRLTQVLQDSLCGNSKVVLLCCVAPEQGEVQETLSTLGFAQRVAQAEMGPTKREREVQAPAKQVQQAGARGGAGAAKLAALHPSNASRIGPVSVLKDRNS